MSEQTTSENGEESVPRRRPLTRGKKWAFRAAALLIVPALLVGIEIGLRLGGYGTTPKLVISVKDSPSALNHVLNPSVEFPYYPATDLSGPEPRRPGSVQNLLGVRAR